MTRQWLFLALLVPARSTGAQQVAHLGAATGPTVALRLWIPDGEVQVRYWDRDSVDIQAGLGPGARLVGAVGGTAGKYAIEFATPTDRGFPLAKVTLTMPRRATLWVKSTTAAVVVSGGIGQLDVLTVTGRTIVRDAAGTVTVESIEGDVELWRLPGLARVRGGAGRVALNDLTGQVSVSTVSGAIDVNRGDVARYSIPDGHLETLGGTVRVRGRQAPGGGLDIETHDGPVDLRFLAGSLPRFQVDRAHQGAVDARVEQLGGSVPDRGVSVHTFKGTLNIGTIPGIR